MARAGKIAIVGGASSVANCLLGTETPDAVAFVRRNPGPGARQVARYQEIAAADLEGFAAVINCAGAVTEEDAELEEANVTLPANLARACREAGVGRLVHLSSFSVYGSAEAIDRQTVPSPLSAYGRSKLRGDQALLAAGSADFQPVIARFPAILDAARPNAKVAQLFAAWRRFGFLPVPAGDVRRSMISSRLVARVLARLALGDESGVVLAADPVPFSYRLAAQAIQDETGLGARMIPVPGMALAPVRLVAPGLYASLFSDSLLAAPDNYAAEWGSDLLEALRETVR